MYSLAELDFNTDFDFQKELDKLLKSARKYYDYLYHSKTSDKAYFNDKKNVFVCIINGNKFEMKLCEEDNFNPDYAIALGIMYNKFGSKTKYRKYCSEKYTSLAEHNCIEIEKIAFIEVCTEFHGYKKFKEYVDAIYKQNKKLTPNKEKPKQTKPKKVKKNVKLYE